MQYSLKALMIVIAVASLDALLIRWGAGPLITPLGLLAFCTYFVARRRSFETRVNLLKACVACTLMAMISAFTAESPRGTLAPALTVAAFCGVWVSLCLGFSLLR